MSVYRFRAVNEKREEMMEQGTVVAGNEDEAREKLKQIGFDKINLKRIGGIWGFLKAITADIK